MNTRPPLRLRLLLLSSALLLPACASIDSGGEAVICYYDGDEDGWGSVMTHPMPVESCDGQPNVASQPGDCDDSAAWIHPGAEDVVGDGFDADCQGGDRVYCPTDADGDGWSAGEEVTDAADCDLVNGPFPGDCDDADPDSRPDGAEMADDGVDQDCNGVDAVGCHYDGDGDGYGIAEQGMALDGTCGDSEFEALTGDDCDDAEPSISPAGEDLPGDDLDQDCTGFAAVECPADADGDGWGGPEIQVIDWVLCFDPTGLDCDDLDPDVHPDAPDIVDDGVDQDCSGQDTVTCYYDGDSDGWGSVIQLVEGPTCDPQLLLADVTGDCDDASAWIAPDAVELCDGFDNDCDGVIETGQQHIQTFLPFGMTATPISFGSFTIETRFYFEPSADPDVTLFAIEDSPSSAALALYTASDVDWTLVVGEESHVFPAPPDTATESGHVALVSDGAELRLYWDGALHTSFTPATSPNWGAVADLTFLEEYPQETLWTTGGHYDEVRVWDLPRDEADLLAWACAPMSGPSTGLVAYLPLDTDFIEIAGQGQPITPPTIYTPQPWQL